MTEFAFGKDKIEIKKGYKASNDYLIFLNKVQISDELLFEALNLSIISEDDAKFFIEHYVEYSKIKLGDNYIKTYPSPLDKNDLYDYCMKLNAKFDIQMLIFVSILRCDIDNICYPPPVLNGCVRFFVQILLLFAYKFKWEEYYIKDKKPGANLPKFIFEIGFIPGKEGRKLFSDIYKVYLENRNQ